MGLQLAMEAWVHLLLPREYTSLEEWTEYVAAYAATLDPDQLPALDRALLPKVHILAEGLVHRHEQTASNLLVDMYTRLQEHASREELLEMAGRRQDVLARADSIRPLMRTTNERHARHPSEACAPMESVPTVLPEEVARLLTERDREDAATEVVCSTRASVEGAVRGTCWDLSSVGLRGTLSDAIGRLNHLTRLDLTQNDLEQLPSCIGLLTALEVFNVDRNLLVAIPESIGNLTRLRELRVGFNQLEALPESIGNLTDLRLLIGTKNVLRRFPRSLMRLVNLRLLQFPLNPVEEAERAWFRQTLLPSLRRIESTVGTL